MSTGAEATVRVVLDTTVLSAAAFNPAGVGEKVVQYMVRGDIKVTMSNRLRHE